MDLVKMHRSEKENAKLSELPDNVYEIIKADLEKQMSELSTLSGLEADMAKDVLLKDKALLRSLRAVRIKKVIKNAVADACLTETKHHLDFMQPKERELYSGMVGLIKAI